MLRVHLSLLLGLALLLAATAPAMADPVGPFLDHVEEKTDEAGDDPEGFAKEHTSQEGIAQELRWTREYSCFAAREAAKEAGQDPPDLSALGCPQFEEVREVDGSDLDDPDEAVAEPLDEVDGVLSDARGTVDEVAKDPQNAAQTLLGFLQRSLQAVGRIAGSTVDGVRALVEDLIALPIQSTMWIIEQAAILQKSGHQVATDAVDALTDEVMKVGDAVGETVGSVAQNLRRGFEGWFSGSSETLGEDDIDRRTKDRGDATDDLTSGLEDALPDL